MPKSFTLNRVLLSILFLVSITSCSNEDSSHSKTIVASAANQNKQDTSATEDGNDVLRGTTVLKASEKNMESGLIYGLWLDSLSSSECMSHSESPAPTQITGISEPNDSTLMITANISENCGYHFLGEIEIIPNNTLNLIYHGYGGFASCVCCFGLTYKIAIRKDDDNKFEKLKFVTINGYAKARLPKIKR